MSNVPQISSCMQLSSEINDYSWRSNASSQERSKIKTGQTYESGMNHNFNFGRKIFVDRSSQCPFCRYPKPNHSPEKCFKNPNNNHLGSANVRHVTNDFPVPMQTFDDRTFNCDIEGLSNRTIEQGDQYSEVKSSNYSVCDFGIVDGREVLFDRGYKWDLPPVDCVSVKDLELLSVSSFVLVPQASCVDRELYCDI